MKFLHTADLHIGMKWFDHSLREDQEYILEEILRIADERQVDGVIISGDVYDDTSPTEESIRLLSGFLTKVSQRHSLYVIAGNHDSAEKLGFARAMMQDNVHFSGTFMQQGGRAERITVRDEHGDLNIYLLPYIRTATVRHLHGDDESITSPDAAFKTVMEDSDVDPSARNILLCHQYVCGKEVDLDLSDSESFKEIGRDQCISSRLMDAFDYVALGHIHKPQKAGRDTIRYSGSPLKYSLSEIGYEKSVVVFEVREKGDVVWEKVPLKPLHDMVEVEGDIDEILGAVSEMDPKALVYANLSAPAEHATRRLAEKCERFHLEFRFRAGGGDSARAVHTVEEIRGKEDIDLFDDFFRDRYGTGMTEEERAYMLDVISRARDGGSQ